MDEKLKSELLKIHNLFEGAYVIAQGINTEYNDCLCEVLKTALNKLWDLMKEDGIKEQENG